MSVSVRIPLWSKRYQKNGLLETDYNPVAYYEWFWVVMVRTWGAPSTGMGPEARGGHGNYPCDTHMIGSWSAWSLA